MSIPEKFIDPETGNIKPYRMYATDFAKQRADSIAQGAARIAREEADAATPELRKRLQIMQRQYAEAKQKGDRSRMEMYGHKIDELKAEQAQADKLAAFDHDAWTKAVIDGRDALARSGKSIYDGSNPADVDLLVALIDQRHSFPSVEAFKAAYQEVEDRVTSDNLDHHRRKASDAEIVAAKSEMEAAQAQTKRLEAELQAVNDV